jgi:hypothetical protein
MAGSKEHNSHRVTDMAFPPFSFWTRSSFKPPETRDEYLHTTLAQTQTEVCLPAKAKESRKKA